ncbi:oxygen-dependent coproporphyrinogen oxidase [Lewinellaceae bacterium SD302]|nr:oxygen-dependent coproporphyrinogen oxidase [Lewinellaceae bacterium SD302]
MPQKDTITNYFKSLQDNICQALSAADGSTFVEDSWKRPGGGGGRARVIRGQHIEKGGVNFSAVHGVLPPAAARSLRIGELETSFYATGVSIVLHPRNPLVPIIHMNVRYFELDGGRCWFGGGIDLTPHYIDRDQAQWFHEQLKTSCDRFHPDFYPRFTAEADDYFYLPHRKETRGVGGIFYDRLEPGYEGLDKQQLFEFTAAIGETFAPTYLQLLDWNKDKTYTERQQEWQQLRRGRYVEFNLVWDRGTKFGLTTNGRTESILMSLPPMAGWEYDFQPKEGSAEAETLEMLRKNMKWVE